MVIKCSEFDEAWEACDAYYVETKTIVLVPVVVKYHEPTGIVYSFVPPTQDVIEQAIANKGKVP